MYGATGWASNFLLTRPKEIRDMLSNLDLTVTKTIGQCSTPSFIFKGKELFFTATGFAKVQKAFDTCDPNAFDIIQQEAVREFQPQAEAMGAITELLTAVFGTIGNHMTDADMRAANTQYAYINNVRREADLKLQQIKSIVSVVFRTCFSFDPFDIDYQEFASEMLRIMNFVDSSKLEADLIGKDRQVMRTILETHQKAATIQINPRYAQIPSFMTRAFDNRFKILQDLAIKSAQLLRGTHNRMEPVCVLFTGPPEVGKSATVKFLQAYLCYKGDKVYSPEMSYVFNGTDDYWEGYCGQPFVLMDDLFKNADTSIRANEACAIIGMVNTSVYALNMAFEGKGAAFFNSDYIFASTNIANNGIDQCTWNIGLTDAEAVKRRIHICLHRTKKIEKDVVENTYRVDRCNLLPHMIGQTLTSAEVGDLIIGYREEQERLHKSYVYTHQRLDQASYQTRKFDYSTGAVLRDSILVTREPTDVTSQQVQIIGDTTYGVQDFPQGEPPDLDMSRNPDSGTLSFTTQTGPIKPYKLYERFAAHEFITQVCYRLAHDYKTLKIEYKYLIFTFTFLTAAVASVLVLRSCFGMTTQSSSTKFKDGNKGNKKKGGKKPGEKVMRKPDFHRSTFNTQTVEDNYLNSIVNKVSKSVLYVQGTCHKQGVSFRAILVHIRDGYVCTPAHFMRVFEHWDSATMEIAIPGREGLLEIPFPQDFISVDGEDIIFFKLPSGIDLPPAIYKYCVDYARIPNIEPGTPIKLLKTDQYGVSSYLNLLKKPGVSSFHYPGHDSDFIITNPITYTASTQGGDSGGVITIEGPQGQALVVGLHSGFHRAYGFSAAMPICKEYFDHFLGSFETQFGSFPLQVTKLVSGPDMHFPPKESKICRSPMYGWNGPSTTAPAHLSPFLNEEGVLIDPYNKAVVKLHQKQTPPCPMPVVEIIDYLDGLYPRTDGAGLVSFEEALRGDPEKGSNAICMSTSPGYPFAKKATKGKAPYVYAEGDVFHYSPEFLQLVNDKIEALRRGEQIEVYWADVLKDETRTLEKVQLGKTRLFCTCPLDLLIIMRIFFLDFVTYVQSLAATKPIAVGINAHSPEWAILHARLARCAGSIIAGDFSNYDGKLPKFVGQIALEFINHWYDDGQENASVRALLFEHIYNPTRIIYDTVYQVVDGNPSGNPITSIYNSLCNIIMCFVVLTEDFDLRADQFEMVVYGDDNVMGLEKEGIRCSDLTPFFKSRFDMDYTHFSKSENESHDTLSTIRFLAREFVKDGTNFRAPLELTTIVESTYFLWGSSGHDKAMVSTARSFFLELSHHPKDVFDSVSEKFLSQVKLRIPRLYEAIADAKETYFAYYVKFYHPKKRLQVVITSQKNS